MVFQMLAALGVCVAFLSLSEVRTQVGIWMLMLLNGLREAATTASQCAFSRFL